MPKAPPNIDVLFAQLPSPRHASAEAPDNTPLAPACLVLSLRRERPNLRAEILPSHIMDTAGDAALARAILERRPRVVAFSLYLWNSLRTMALANALRHASPGIRLLFGGPEVTPDNRWLLEHPGFDTGVVGEGESRVAPVIDALLAGSEPALITRRQDADLGANNVNPYAAGLLRPNRDGQMYLETSRGCAFRCRYCYYHKSSETIRPRDPDEIRAALRWAFAPANGVREIYLMDPTWNRSPRWREWLAEIRDLQSDRPPRRRLRLHAEVRADLLTASDVRLMREAGMSSVEVGLQSIHAPVLRASGRAMDLDRFKTGVRLLRRAGIRVITDLIIGLPGDTPAGVRASAAWLRRSRAYDETHPFVLSVLPGTDFRANADRLGLDYDELPPYLIDAGVHFDEPSLRAALNDVSALFDLRATPQGGPINPSPARLRDGSVAVINVDKPDVVSAIPAIAARCQNVSTVWFTGRHLDSRADTLAAAIATLTDANPFNVWHLVFKGSRFPSPDALRDMITPLIFPEHYLNRFFALFDDAPLLRTVTITLVIGRDASPATLRRLRRDYAGVADVTRQIGAVSS